MTMYDDIAAALGIGLARVSQLKKAGMPVDSVEAAVAWKKDRRARRGRVEGNYIPVKPLDTTKLDGALSSVLQSGDTVLGTDDKEMDFRIAQQVELCQMTRQAFITALQEADPAQAKLYVNFDKAVTTLMKMEKERAFRLQEKGRLVDADEAAARYGKLLGQIRTIVERYELNFAPKANPQNPPVALIAYREFRDDLFRRLSDIAPENVAHNVNAELGSEVAEKKAEVSPEISIGDYDEEEPSE